MSERTLRITSGPAAGTSVEIDAEIIIGREHADLTIEDSELSRRHVALRPVEQGVEIEDLGSLNGTFVNGRQISEPHTLIAPGTLKIGISQATVEVSLPQETHAAGTAGAPMGAGRTVARPVPTPPDDAAEAVADADVTAQRPVVDPDATTQRPIADPANPPTDPDVTAQRPVVDPDVTVQRPVHAPGKSPPPGPDVTVARPVGSAGPPPGATRPPAPPPDEAGKRSGGPPVPVIAGVVLGVVALIILLLVLTSGDDAGAKTRKLDMRLDVGTVTARDKRLSEQRPGKKPIRWRFFGEIRGQPFGTGTVRALVTLQPGGPPPGAPAGGKPPSGKPKPATVTPRFVLRFPNGTLIANERIKSTREAGGLKFVGTGRILSGTGDFEDAKGTFKVTGGRPKFDEPGEKVRWRGSVEY